MDFKRQPADTWQRDIPGSRWFRADLHVHTVDDHPGGRAKMPETADGDVTDPQALERYATLFLKGLIANQVQVVGLTPHSPRAGESPETSAVWKIVDKWNSGIDSDGVPFREKVYAVFPGFEPNVREGSQGVHVLLLFDPEIGRDRYLKLFDALMSGSDPWTRNIKPNTWKLQQSPLNAKELFTILDERESESKGSWRYIALAPHFESDNGLFRSVRRDPLRAFPCGKLSGYELKDNKLACDISPHAKIGRTLLPFISAHHQAFFHASDAYAISDIGRRHTWMKLASPRIEALRQAFIASDSRMRTGHMRGANGDLLPIANPPDIHLDTRPWLKNIRVTGAASFFGRGNHDTSTIQLSPDLTCIIGGSMTGKSTLLDGLRVHIGAPLPTDLSVRAQVEAHGGIFGAAEEKIELECPGRDPTAPPCEQWPAQFFAQNELQRLSQDASAVEDILGRLMPSETAGIKERERALQELDECLLDTAKQLTKLDDSLADSEQALTRAIQAKEALDTFEAVGVDQLHQLDRHGRTWADIKLQAESAQAHLKAVASAIGAIRVPAAEVSPTTDTFDSVNSDRHDLDARLNQITQQLSYLTRELTGWIGDIGPIIASNDARRQELRATVERALAKRGLGTAKLQEFKELTRQASLLASYQSHLDQTRSCFNELEDRFIRIQEERGELVADQRRAFDRVLDNVEREFDDRIRVIRIDCGDDRRLDEFIRSLKQKGVTRWWNDLKGDNRPSPQALSEALGRQSEANASAPFFGMSSAVQKSLREGLTRAAFRTLNALRCPDRFELELRVDNDTYRRLDELSGGQRVSVLLSLLLETDDSRPLVIDQPEDELDNRFLFETVLPALKRLKGRRQVIMATHNANIVVNGDADMVIQLDASANRGRVSVSGAIEDPDVRDTVVRTVDGGEEAFRLRRRKYGF